MRGSLTDLQLAIRASLAEKKHSSAGEQATVDLLQAQLTAVEPGARIDTSTPKDGHCLFHACRRAGILDDCEGGLDIFEMRKILVHSASEEQLGAASASMGITVREYKDRMSRSEWGDELMIVLLSAVFDKAITLFKTDSVATVYPNGSRTVGADRSSLWIAHRAEVHYYGVLREHMIDPIPLSSGKVVRFRLRGKTPPQQVLSLQPPPDQSEPEKKQASPPARNKKPPLFGQAPENKPRLCGNCGQGGHVATTCQQPCFACGGMHIYSRCDHPDLHVPARRQAARNRVTWEGYGSVVREQRQRKGMKPRQAGRDWVRKEYDPEYTPTRDISPKRAVLNKFNHISDRSRISLRLLWSLDEEGQMEGLIDGGFVTDCCVDEAGRDVGCLGILQVMWGVGRRKLSCSGVPNKHRHRFHWLNGSVFHGHTHLTVYEVNGVLFSFAAQKDIQATAMDTGLGRKVVGELFDRLRMAACMIATDHREAVLFENCQIEADETVIRKERVYEKAEKDMPRKRIGTYHHSIIGLTKRGSTLSVLYMCEPAFVAVDSNGKPGPPKPPSGSLARALLAKHLGNFVVLHTDGAKAYSSACKRLVAEGFTVVQDSVNHSDAQWVAFGRHDLTDEADWEQCEFALKNDRGEVRIRVLKGCQKMEGMWSRMKHGTGGIPEEVHNDDARLNMYAMHFMWRSQVCGDPYREVLRMCRCFRMLPHEQKSLVFQYGLKGGEQMEGKRSRSVVRRLPEVQYCESFIDKEISESDGSDAGEPRIS